MNPKITNNGSILIELSSDKSCPYYSPREVIRRVYFTE